MIRDGYRYTFTVEARDANGVARARATTTAALPPRGGALGATPAVAEAMRTRVTLSTAGRRVLAGIIAPLLVVFH